MPHTMTTPGLWPSMFFLERGWLSANNIVFLDADAATIVDTGGHCATTGFTSSGMVEKDERII
mgnify:CR=1 FL=1